MVSIEIFIKVYELLKPGKFIPRLTGVGNNMYYIRNMEGCYMKKRLPKILLSSVMIATMSMTSVTAAVSNSSSSSEATATVAIEEAGVSNSVNEKELEAVIKETKKKIKVPSTYTKFNFDLQTPSTKEKIWSLTWRDESNNRYIRVEVDQKYRINSYYLNGEKDYWGVEAAKYLKSELKDKADGAIKQMAPDLAKKVEYVDASYTGIYDNSYLYEYVRIENGIKLPENNIAVVVNAATGEIQSVNIHWLYDVKVPSSKKLITKEEATDIIKENLKMNLSYYRNYRYWDEADKQDKIFLAYTPDRNYIGVDALTGAVYLEKNVWVDGKNTAATEEAKADSASSAEGGLTKEEISKVEEYKNLLSQEAAAKKITGNSALEFDKNLVIVDASLERSYDDEKKVEYTWRFSFQDPRPVDYEKEGNHYRAYAYGRVDASTGKILNYYSSIKTDHINSDNVKLKYSKEDSQKILEKFLKAQMKDRFNHVELSTEGYDYIIGYRDHQPVYGGYSFNYVRMNEGVPYPYNNITGSVNGLTGKIFEVQSNWEDDVVFESTKGAITAEKALDHYLSKDGYELVYEIHQKNQKDQDSSYQDVEREIKLVYVPSISPSYISPFTGEQLDYKGDVYKETKPYAYKDVENNEANRNIWLLADMGIGFEGELFQANQEVTAEEVFQLLIKMGAYISEEQKLKNTLSVSKEEMAYYIIVGLGLEKAAQIPGIYRTGLEDENIIGKDYLGAVALAKGLGIMEGDQQNNFNPKQKVTRAEVMDYLFGVIEGRSQLR